MALRDELHRRRDDILAVAARHGVSNLRLFGSVGVAGGEERTDSDMDLLVDLPDDRGFDDYLALIDELESLFARRVEVVIERSLSPHFRPYVEAEAQPL